MTCTSQRGKSGSCRGIAQRLAHRKHSESNSFDGIDVGYKSAPAVVDWDGDGDADLVVGAGDGPVDGWGVVGAGVGPGDGIGVVGARVGAEAKRATRAGYLVSARTRV